MDSITDILGDSLRSLGLEEIVIESKLREKWPEVMGEQVARLTTLIEMKNGMLNVHIRSAALRQQLFECRFQLVEKLNTALNTRAIHDIRLLA